MSLHVKVFIGFVAGTALGIVTHATLGAGHPGVRAVIDNAVEPAGKLFLRALLMCVVPLVASSLVVGVAGLGDLRRLGRIGGRTLAYTVALSVISVVVGLTAANVVRPGTRLDPSVRQSLIDRYGASAPAPQPAQTFGAAIVDVLPENPLAAAAADRPKMLALMAFCVLFAVALGLLDAARRKPLLDLAESLFAATSKLVDLVMKVAPAGVACLLFTMTSRFGWELLSSLSVYVLTVLGALAFHQLVVYGAALRLIGRVSPRRFFARTRHVMLTAFSTSSSNATLPTALEAAERDLGVPRDVASFVLTVGATANQNGTALFEGVTVLFLAQVFGVELTLAQQVSVLALAVVGGIGTAGVPSGSIPFVIMVLGTVGVPVEGIAIVLGVDRFLDMCRTVLNVTGDLAAAVVIARGEGADVMRDDLDEVQV